MTSDNKPKGAASANSSSAPAPSGAPSAAAADREGDAKVEALSARVLAEYLRLEPVRATEVGEHKHDARWPDMSEAGELYEAYALYDLGAALAALGECKEAVKVLKRSEQIQGQRSEIDSARAQCG